MSLILSLAIAVSLLPSMAVDAAAVAAETTNVWEAASADATDETSVNIAAYKNGGEAFKNEKHKKKGEQK